MLFLAEISRFEAACTLRVSARVNNLIITHARIHVNTHSTHRGRLKTQTTRKN